MFVFCKFIDRVCACATISDGDTYCGMSIGTKLDNMVSNLKECPRLVNKEHGEKKRKHKELK